MGIVIIIPLSGYFIFDEYNHSYRYRFEIIADKNVQYSLIIPMPVDLQTAKPRKEFGMPEGFKIITTEKGYGLQIVGNGHLDRTIRNSNFFNRIPYGKLSLGAIFNVSGTKNFGYWVNVSIVGSDSIYIYVTSSIINGNTEYVSSGSDTCSDNGWQMLPGKGGWSIP